MEALPLAYNRDMQEDKEGLFDTVDTLQPTLRVFAGMVRTIKVNVKRVRQAIKRDYILATDLADYLVKKGLPFREAHGVISKLSKYAVSRDKSFHELGLSEYHGFSLLFDEDVYAITLESSLAARNVIGGTSPQQVGAALTRAREILNGTKWNKESRFAG